MRDDAVLRRALPLGRGLGRKHWAQATLTHITIINHTQKDDNDTSTPMKGAADNIFDRNYANGLLTKQLEGGSLKTS